MSRGCEDDLAIASASGWRHFGYMCINGIALVELMPQYKRICSVLQFAHN